jgi:hypothetical protein
MRLKQNKLRKTCASGKINMRISCKVIICDEKRKKERNRQAVMYKVTVFFNFVYSILKKNETNNYSAR